MTTLAGGPAAEIRRLDPTDDADRVADLYRRAADYLLVERGDRRFAAAAQAFFADRPPGDAVTVDKLGLFAADGCLIAAIDLAFGYPGAGDAYLGLLLLTPAQRGRGLGRVLLDRVKGLAAQRRATRLLLGVLDENVRARAFWEREGFVVVQSSGPHRFGEKQHIVHRMELQLGRVGYPQT